MVTTASTSAVVSVVKAVEHVAVEEVKTLANQLSTKTAADVKTIVHEVAQQTVDEANETPSSVLEDVGEGLGEIVEDVVEGAGKVAEQVEAHPELLVEGALAVGIGVVSVVQPELIAGSVALVGKMAADSVTNTMNDIIVTSGTGVVKEVAKDVADENDNTKLKATESKESASEDDRIASEKKDSKVEAVPGEKSTLKEDKTAESSTDESVNQIEKSEKNSGARDKEGIKEESTKTVINVDKKGAVSETTVEGRVEQREEPSIESVSSSTPVIPPGEVKFSQETSVMIKETEIPAPDADKVITTALEEASKDGTKSVEKLKKAELIPCNPANFSDSITAALPLASGSVVEAPKPKAQLWTKPVNSSSFAAHPFLATTSSIDTHAAVVAAHQSIIELHQKLDKMQSSLDIMAKALLAHGIQSPIQAIETAVTDSQTEAATGTVTASMTQMSLVLVDPRKTPPDQPTHKKRGSMFGSFGMGWLFGGGSGTKSAPAAAVTTTTTTSPEETTSGPGQVDTS
ncbi:hypothetical protein F5884DRAFT_878565 [Xylogone sp. PMI_703]|nr:hypothetical protein F5884DRAFT_878565 [Xylogone sp. PMI_703]